MLASSSSPTYDLGGHGVPPPRGAFPIPESTWEAAQLEELGLGYSMRHPLEKQREQHQDSAKGAGHSDEGQEEGFGHPNGHPPSSIKECEQECAQEECLDSEQCGADSRPPKPENLLCKCIDTRPLLPVTLTVSTVVGGIMTLLLQVPMISRLLGVSETRTSLFFISLYFWTLGCMAYCAFADPGQMRKEQFGAPLPLRAYKSWQYKRPIRRYDHYCRWVSNSVGLLNHREFLVMLAGLALIGASGIGLDIVLAISILNLHFWNAELLLLLHLTYSAVLTAFVIPILRIHVGLVARSEMAAEWKRNDFYIASEARQGKNVPASELDDDEFNALSDSLIYDRSRNAFDRGWALNCVSFWCLPRWSKGQLGEF